MPDPARGLFAFEFNESGLSGAGGYVSPLGAVFDTVCIAGAVTAVEISPVSGKVIARISDPTGVFVVDAGKNDSAAGWFFGGVSVPSFVSVTGRAESSGGMRIVAEAAVAIDREMRNSWISVVSRRTIERLESAAGNNETGRIEDLCLYAGLIERAIDAVHAGPGGEGETGSGEPDHSEKVLELIDLHSGDKGIPVEDLIRICASSRIKEADAKRAIESLVEEGECYLPAGGYIRRL